MSAVFASQGEDRDLTLNFLICCPRCEGTFSLHQPDTDLPDRLLATCDECKAWYVLTDKEKLRFAAPPVIGPARF